MHFGADFDMDFAVDFVTDFSVDFYTDFSVTFNVNFGVDISAYFNVNFTQIVLKSGGFSYLPQVKVLVDYQGKAFVFNERQIIAFTCLLMAPLTGPVLFLIHILYLSIF